MIKSRRMWQTVSVGCCVGCPDRVDLSSGEWQWSFDLFNNVFAFYLSGPFRSLAEERAVDVIGRHHRDKLIASCSAQCFQSQSRAGTFRTLIVIKNLTLICANHLQLQVTCSTQSQARRSVGNTFPEQRSLRRCFRGSASRGLARNRN